MGEKVTICISLALHISYHSIELLSWTNRNMWELPSTLTAISSFSQLEMHYQEDDSTSGVILLGLVE